MYRPYSPPRKSNILSEKKNAAPKPTPLKLEHVIPIELPMQAIKRKCLRLMHRFADILISGVDSLLMGVGRVSRHVSTPKALVAARCIGEFGILMRDFPCLPVWQLSSHNRKIAFIGNRQNLPEVTMLLFGW